MSPSLTPAWTRLSELAVRHRDLHMRELFARDPSRGQRYRLRACGLLLDYAKNRIDDAVLSALLGLAQASGVEECRDAMFRGNRINTTEHRAVLHTALRRAPNEPLVVDGEDLMPMIAAERARMFDFVHDVRSGGWTGHDGQRITDVVNIGIGGSDLGPAMVCEALAGHADATLRVHFVSNADGAMLLRTLARLEPARTLFVVASKTFTTVETLANARSAREWLLAHCGGNTAAVARHFVAVSTNAERVAEFGIDPANMFAFWDWVGGRYSLWSSIGLSIALYLGAEHFLALLAGARAMDQHFCNAPAAQNMPLLLALIGVWNANFLGARSLAIAPYSHALHRLPAFLQQLDMESNGKSVRVDGSPTDYGTGPIVWGEPGTNAQHAFFQLLHQGSDPVPVDFILPLHQPEAIAEQQLLLAANCLAQSAALMQGKRAEEAQAEMTAQGMSAARIEALLPHRVFPGNRPSNTLLLDALDPAGLGALIALYEHKVFVQGVLWGVNSFDQWGVELGKQLATLFAPALRDGSAVDCDASTRALIEYLREHR